MELKKSFKNYEKVTIQFNIELKKSEINDVNKEPNQEPIFLFWKLVCDNRSLNISSEIETQFQKNKD